jgi:hypothetical protein
MLPDGLPDTADAVVAGGGTDGSRQCGRGRDEQAPGKLTIS